MGKFNVALNVELDVPVTVTLAFDIVVTELSAKTARVKARPKLAAATRCRMLETMKSPFVDCRIRMAPHLWIFPILLDAGLG
jgi:hypothetical protein